MLDRYYAYNRGTNNLIGTDKVNWVTSSGITDLIVATDQNLVFTSYNTYYVFGYQNFPGGFNKAIFIPDNYVWTLSTISGICYTTVSGAGDGYSLATSWGDIYDGAYLPVFPYADHSMFVDGQFSDHAYIVTASGGQANLRFDNNYGILFTVSGSSVSTDRAFLAYDYPLKPPFKIQVKFKLSRLNGLGLSNDPGPDIIGLRYSTTELNKSSRGTRAAGIMPVYRSNDSLRCNVGFYYYDTTGGEQYFGKWNKKWEPRSGLYIYPVDDSVWLYANTYYLAEIVVNADRVVEFAIKNVDGSLLGGNKRVDTGPIFNSWIESNNSGTINASWEHFYLFFGEIGPDQRYQSSYCDIDYSWIKVWPDYICDNPSDINDFDLYYNQPEDRLFLGVATVSGAIVVGGANTDYAFRRRWVSNKEYCQTIRFAGCDFYTVVGSGEEARTIKYYGEFRGKGEGYISPSRSFKSGKELIYDGYITDIAAVSGSAFDGEGNTVIVGTSDGLTVVRHDRDQPIYNYYSYGPENVILMDSFVDDALGFHPLCWINESNDIDKQYLRVTTDSGDPGFFGTDHWHTDGVYAYNRGTLAGIRRYEKYGPHSTIGDYRLVVDDKYVWWPKLFRYEGYIWPFDPRDLGIPIYTRGIIRADKFSGEMEYFDVSRYINTFASDYIRAYWDQWHSVEIHGLRVVGEFVYFIIEFTAGRTDVSKPPNHPYNFSIVKFDRETFRVVQAKHYYQDDNFRNCSICELWPYEEDGYFYGIAQINPLYGGKFLETNSTGTIWVVLDADSLDVVDYLPDAFRGNVYTISPNIICGRKSSNNDFLWVGLNIRDTSGKTLHRVDMSGKGNWSTDHFKFWVGYGEQPYTNYFLIDDNFMYITNMREMRASKILSLIGQSFILHSILIMLVLSETLFVIQMNVILD